MGTIKCLGVPSIKGGHGHYFEVKKLYCMLEIDILRNPSPNSFGVLRGDF